MYRRNQSIDLPQTPFRFVYVELPIIILVGNVGLQGLVDSCIDTLVRLVTVGHIHGDVVGGNSNEWLFGDVFAPHPCVPRSLFHEVHDHIKGREANICIDLCDVLSESLL
jgi:hypothetical protein